ncbi:5-dehydro-2-deoxygluconokinase [Rhodobacteraceae bacterium RKSG542]|uniref:5-dehydro-2-deoxygluconokinase n=1 Tax=Pseudovibrio flavus TaxID=2529854 RepID=UPI0012BD0935|nr:5-dehydro-2-deoxygluconokinase [Pseudovibrio flavus]MTI18023.1 5-dehydro-2-deoxygluconokinase [Pseudovibrio flavus]
MECLSKLKNNNFLVLGRAGMDLYADPPGTEITEAANFYAALGGSSANIAVALTRYGVKASMISVVSDDAVGRYVVAQMEKYGIGHDYVRTTGGEARTSLAVVETRLENCQAVLYRNGAADFELCEADVEGIPYGDYAALVVTGTALAVEPNRSAVFKAVNLAKAAGTPIIIDLDYRPYSWESAETAVRIYTEIAALCDIIVGNDVEFGVMAGDINAGKALAKELAQTSASIVVYKMGPEGSVTFTAEEEQEMGVFKVQALKPTGAGDAFMGGFLSSLAKGLDLRTSVMRGSAAAAIVVTRVACSSAMPTNEELDAFIESRNGIPA